MHAQEEAEDKEDEELLEMVADAVRLGQQQYLDTLHEELSNGNAVGIVQAALQQAGVSCLRACLRDWVRTGWASGLKENPNREIHACLGFESGLWHSSALSAHEPPALHP